MIPVNKNYAIVPDSAWQTSYPFQNSMDVLTLSNKMLRHCAVQVQLHSRNSVKALHTVRQPHSRNSVKVLHTVRQPHSRNSVSQVQPHSRNSVQVLDTVQHKFNPIPRIQCKCQIVSGTSATLIQEFSESTAHCPATPFQEFSVTSATPFQKFSTSAGHCPAQVQPHSKNSVQVSDSVWHKCNPDPGIQ